MDEVQNLGQRREHFAAMIFPSQARKESMAFAFAELDKVANPVICEVGRIRNFYAGESDGHSTLAFLDYVNSRNGRLYSVDKDRATEITCLEVLSKAGVDSSRLELISEDAIVQFGQHPHAAMDLLYLDGWDLSDPESATKHLLCFMLAERLIPANGLVLIDDTGYPDGGKGKLIVPVAVLMGWQTLFTGCQVLLRKT